MQSGLEAPEKGSVAMRLLAEEAGQVIVTLSVTWAHGGDEHVLTDSITVQVYLLTLVHTFSLLILSIYHRMANSVTD